MSNRGLKAVKLLRDLFVGDRELKAVTEGDGDKLIFDMDGDKVEFEKSMQTAYKIPKSTNEFYTLYSLVFFLKNKDMLSGAYFTKCGEKNIKAVKFVDKASLLKYFTGKIKDEDNKDLQITKTKRTTSSAKKTKRSKSSTIVSAQKKLKLIAYWEAKEQALSDVNSVLRCKVNIAETILGLVNDIRRARDKKTSSSLGKYEPQTETINPQEGVNPRLLPIIIVPPVGSLLNLKNVKSFLAAGILEGLEKNLSNSQSVRRNGVKYRIVGTPLSLSDDEWQRVVCVVVNGQDWQFKNWKLKSKAAIFDSMLGVYLHYDDAKVPKEISQLNIRRFPIKKQQRNQDKIQSHRVWEAIDQFMKEKKAGLFEFIK